MHAGLSPTRVWVACPAPQGPMLTAPVEAGQVGQEASRESARRDTPLKAAMMALQAGPLGLR